MTRKGRVRALPHQAAITNRSKPGRPIVKGEGLDIHLVTDPVGDQFIDWIVGIYARMCKAMTDGPTARRAMLGIREEMRSQGPARVAQLGNYLMVIAQEIYLGVTNGDGIPNQSQVAIGLLIGMARDVSEELGYDMGCSLAEKGALEEAAKEGE